jgi:phage major head subunit gpT-like protein
MKPLVFQLRLAPQFTQKTKSEDDHVFLHDEYLYGVKARYTAAFGFHQLAFASKAELTPENYETARIALSTQYRPDGSPLGVRPTHLIVGPAQEATARRLLEAELINGGETNIWKGSAQLIVSQYLVQ